MRLASLLTMLVLVVAGADASAFGKRGGFRERHTGTKARPWKIGNDCPCGPDCSCAPAASLPFPAGVIPQPMPAEKLEMSPAMKKIAAGQQCPCDKMP